MLSRKIKRLLLIDPPITRPRELPTEKARVGVVPPLGVAYIAAVLEEEGFEVKILDCIAEGSLKASAYGDREIRYGLTDYEIEGVIRDYSPDLVGVSCTVSNKYKDAHIVCRIVKEIDRDIFTVMGGAHPSTLPELVMEDKNVDFIVIGEGEYTLRDLIRTLNSNGKLSDLDGLAYRDGDEVKIIPKTKFIENLDELPFPARHLLPMEKYSEIVSPHSGIKRTPFTSMITSRGCPARCTFCVLRKIWGKTYRMRSPENVLDEIEHLIEQYGIKEIHFEDDNLTANKKRAMAIFDSIIQRRLDLTLNSPSGLAIFAMDEELLEKMKECGYYSISIAIESADQEVLKNLIRKNVDLDKTRRLVQKTRELGLKIKGFFILGYPGETREQMQKTLDFAANVGLDWALFTIATPLPGTELEGICRKNDYLVNKDLDYVWSFHTSNIKTSEFTPEYVEKIREEANFNINFKNNINLRIGNYDQAASDFKEVLHLYPHLDFAHFYLGVAYEKKGLIEKAIAEWEKVLELNPEYTEAAEKLSQVKRRLRSGHVSI